MIHFACDSCRTIKASNEIWLLGLAAETVGVVAARREVTILPVWDRDQAVHRLAVHFCSEECKKEFVANPAKYAKLASAGIPQTQPTHH